MASPFKTAGQTGILVLGIISVTPSYIFVSDSVCVCFARVEFGAVSCYFAKGDRPLASGPGQFLIASDFGPRFFILIV
jgi:hypothetical protein